MPFEVSINILILDWTLAAVAKTSFRLNMKSFLLSAYGRSGLSVHTFLNMCKVISDMPRDYHREFSLTAGSSCTISKGDAETRLCSQTSAHCVLPGETNLFCCFPLLSLPSRSQAMSNYLSYLSLSPKRHYYIRQNMHPISLSVMNYFSLSPST